MPVGQTLRYTTSPFDALDADLQHQWESIRSSSSSYRSPFFSFAFIHAVNSVCANVEVAAARDADGVVAILPFVRRNMFDATPVGAGINDAHGILLRRDNTLSAREFLQACGLRSFAFHAAPPNAPGVQQYEVGRGRAYLADLTVDPLGYEHFLRNSSRTIDRQGQKSRRLARELGPLRLEFDCRDQSMLDHLIELKGIQYRRTHTFDILAVSWIRQLLSLLHTNPVGSLRGLLNVLYAGDTPVALHYGILDGDLLHYWFPVYDHRFAYGSPGTQMFLDIARHAATLGVKAIDMGYSEQPYKAKLTNVVTQMSHGLIDANPLRRHIHRSRTVWRQHAKGLWFKDQIKPVVRRLLPNLGGGRYR